MQPSRFGRVASTDVDAQVERYKRLRRKKRDGERRRTRPRRKPDAHAMVRVALARLPYGGVPADELLVHFGLREEISSSPHSGRSWPTVTVLERMRGR